VSRRMPLNRDDPNLDTKTGANGEIRTHGLLFTN
jgi:hypothetical protein